jgi:hypothetical protein
MNFFDEGQKAGKYFTPRASLILLNYTKSLTRLLQIILKNALICNKWRKKNWSQRDCYKHMQQQQQLNCRKMKSHIVENNAVMRKALAAAAATASTFQYSCP